MSTVLVVDDEEHIRKDLDKRLGMSNYIVHTASIIEEARKIIMCEPLDYAIIDLKLDFTSEVGGINVFNFVKRNQPKVKTIVLSGYPFEEVKGHLKKELKEEQELEKILKEIEMDYISKGDKNYIRMVLKKLEELNQKKEQKNCFVIMPFSSTNSCTEDEWNEIFKNVIKPAVEESGFNYKCERANSQFETIIEHILDKLNRSQLVIADITDRNPNVLYELGVRHTLGGPAIVIAQKKEDIPFDLLHYPFKIYSWKTEKEKKEFKKEIKEAIDYLEQNPHKTVSPVRKYLNPITVES